MERRRPHHWPPQNQRRSVTGIFPPECSSRREEAPFQPRRTALILEPPHIGCYRNRFAIVAQVRLQKFLADAGVASRRASEEIITQGRVSVNGETVAELGKKVDPLHDRVTVDGQTIRPKRKIYLALNKPRGLVCSKKDDLGRGTIYDLLP